MTAPTVLISGAGIAGPTLAFWLARRGWHPTVVERAQDLRSSGSPVDVRGSALPVAEAMGVIPALRDAATSVTRVGLYDRDGQRFALIPTPKGQSANGTTELEVPRGDLARILFDATHNDAEFVFGDTITGLQQDSGGVQVTFERAPEQRFDVVVGADGLHSVVRQLTFGPHQQFVQPMGAYVAGMPLPGAVDHPYEVQLHNAPGRLVAIHPASGRALVGFFFRHPAVALDIHDDEGRKRLVVETYREMGWRVPELLERLWATKDLYFDAISRVRLPSWSLGRVAVVGDAASCLSLFGDGSTLAMSGAATLADALAASPHDPAQAFRRYEVEHRARVAPKLRQFGLMASVLIPATPLGLSMRNLAARLLSRP